MQHQMQIAWTFVSRLARWRWANVEQQSSLSGIFTGNIDTYLNPQAHDDINHYTGLILGLCPANERRCYFVTTSLIGWASNQPCNIYFVSDLYYLLCFVHRIKNALHVTTLPQTHAHTLPLMEWHSCCHHNVFIIKREKFCECGLWMRYDSQGICSLYNCDCVVKSPGFFSLTFYEP